MPCCLGYTASKLTTKSGAEGGTRTRALDVGNVASWPLDDFRPHEIMERAARVELASSAWRAEAPAAIPCSQWRETKDRTLVAGFGDQCPSRWTNLPQTYGGANGS